VFADVQRPRPRSKLTPKAINWSAAKKKIMAMIAKTMTMMVEITVSRREGHVTLAVSVRTCWRKVKGLVVFDAICRSVFKDPKNRTACLLP
jgi:hypothetical protein